MVQNCQSIINQLALAIGQAKHRRELLLFKNHPNVPIMSKKITNSICIFRLLKLNQEERSLLRSHTQLMTDGRCDSNNMSFEFFKSATLHVQYVLNTQGLCT